MKFGYVSTARLSRRRVGSKEGGAFRTVRTVLPVPALCTLALVLVAWQITSLVVDPALTSSPIEVLNDFFALAASGALWNALGTSLQELAVGAALGISSGFLLGVLMSEVPVARALLAPVVNFFNATPLVVLIPLLVLIVGISSSARITFVVTITIWPMLLNVVAGLRNVKRSYLEVGRAFGYRGLPLLLRIKLPAAMPYVFAGLRNAVGLAIIGMIVGEMEVSSAGLGFLLILFGDEFRIGQLFAVLIPTSCLGVVAVGLLRIGQARFYPWIAAVGGRR